MAKEDRVKVVFDDVVVSPSVVEKYTFFLHGSTSFLSDSVFTFTPRTPRYPADNEDDFTPRISVAKKISQIEKAISGYRGHMYLYGILDRVPVVSTKTILQRCRKNLRYLDDRYKLDTVQYGDHNFSVGKWMDNAVAKNPEKFGATEEDVKDYDTIIRQEGPYSRIFQPSQLPTKKLRNHYKGCVPDADDSDEHWIIQPVKMFFIGQAYGYSYSLVDVKLSKFMKEHLRDYLKKHLRKLQYVK